MSVFLLISALDIRWLTLLVAEVYMRSNQFSIIWVDS